MSTTIKVDFAIRDELKVQAEFAGRTLGQQIAYLVAQEKRSQRWAEVRAAMQANPPDQQYWDDFAEWDSISAW